MNKIWDKIILPDDEPEWPGDIPDHPLRPWDPEDPEDEYWR